MNSMDLKTQLAQETQAKNQSVELARTALLSTAANFQNQLSESAANFRSDLRDEMKKARESWEESARAERRRWEESSTRATAELEQTKRRLWLWGPLALLVTVLVTVGLTLWGTTFSVEKATGLAFTELQQTEAMKVADLRSQVETARSQLKEAQERITVAKDSLSKLAAQIETEKQRLAEAQARQSRLTTYEGKLGTVFVQIRPDTKPIEYQGRTLIEAETNTR